MTLTLDPQLEQRIQRAQAHGNYQEPADVIEEALNLLRPSKSSPKNNAPPSTPASTGAWPRSNAARAFPETASSKRLLNAGMHDCRTGE